MTIPGNCQFIAGDVSELLMLHDCIFIKCADLRDPAKPLPFPDESFDLVQMRITPSVRAVLNEHV